MLEDSSLLEIYKEGNKEALDILIERYQTVIYSFCYHLTSNKSEADDLFQDTWVKVVSKLSYYDTTKKFSTWVCSIALNLYRDRYRKAKRWLSKVRYMFSDGDGADELYTIAAEELSIEEQLEQKEEKQQLIRAVSTLKDNLRIPLILFYYKDMPYEDIAYILDIPVGTVKSRLNTAKKLLKNKLEVMQNER